MREVHANPGAARERADRLRNDLQREHSPPAAGRAMAARLQRVLGMPGAAAGGSGGASIDALDVRDLERRVRAGPADGGGRDGVRGTARAALIRVLRPYSVHQRLVDEEVLRLVRTLDERVRGVATAQSSLAAELQRLRQAVDGDGRVPPSNGP